MARPHHRKKHKQHLREYLKSRNSYRPGPKGKGTNVFAIVGAVIGLAIGYFASAPNIIWVLVGTIIGGGLGYLAGKKVDSSGEK